MKSDGECRNCCHSIFICIFLQTDGRNECHGHDLLVCTSIIMILVPVHTVCISMPKYPTTTRIDQ